jgi:glyoxylase-like metal-dependent hydrolase (beta-lactamase superfamily II)
MRIRDGLHRLGNGLVNAYLVEEAGEVTIIDAGVPGYWSDLPAELGSMGRTLADVRAIVLTHGHSDHIGFAEWARREGQIPVSVHELDAALARGEVPNPAKGMGPVRLRPLLSFLVFGALKGALRTPRLGEVGTYLDGATLDVPGAPRVILVPGHTPGSAALHVPSHDALFIGDAIATVAVTTGETGPMIAPFTADPAEARRSLDRSWIRCGQRSPGRSPTWKVVDKSPSQGMPGADTVGLARRGSRPKVPAQVFTSALATTDR